MLVPGMLVRTNTALVQSGSYRGIWLCRTTETELTEYKMIDSVPEGCSLEPYLYIGLLPEDDRYAQVLMGDLLVMISIFILEKYE